MELRTPSSRTRDPRDNTRHTRRPRRMHSAAALIAATLLLGAALPALALDGCQVLLCLAASSWREIPQCVPPITQLWRDLARGRPFPSCDMSGGSSSASHSWAVAPSYCPPQYTRVVEVQSGTRYSCDYAGAVAVHVNGQPFSRTWWNHDGDAVTDFSPAARAMLGTWDTRFDKEYAAWLASRPQSSSDESGN